MNPKIFMAYDIRGIYPSEVNEEVTYKIGQAYAAKFKPKNVVVGMDVRTSGPSLKKELIKGFTDAGVDVVDIGTISTDMLYFAVANYKLGGGITVSASHNPKEYNGFKMVREKSIAISSDTGLFEIRDLVLKNTKVKSAKKGKVSKKEILNDYIDHVLKFVDIKKIKPMKVVLSANFGLAGEVAKKIITKIPAKIEYTCLDCQPNGEFPKGRPDPLISERQTETSELVKKEHANFGVAWDADADRCFFFDGQGNFIEGYFIVGLLAKYLLAKKPKFKKIIYDPRLTWATIETVKNAGGIPLINKAGHTFIKDRMRAENALFAGEMSAHYYFRDNFYADNGMIPFLMMLEILSVGGKSLSEILKPELNKYFVSGEINSEVKNIPAILKKAERKYSNGKIKHIDGLSVEYLNPSDLNSSWRFNLRGSNTEPKIRLNVESYNKKLMEEKKDELLKLIRE